jgi:site-specific DNA-cytosine methylase
MKEFDFSYNWTLKDAVFTKDKGKVFSCFACGGGSTMGYKLAGFDVIGHNDIDKKMIEVYKANHNPKYSFLESITTFANQFLVIGSIAILSIDLTVNVPKFGRHSLITRSAHCAGVLP